ncbi:MAG: heme NO-binding domain-containing protein [Spirochaetes bacterium]|nr:heme NO-binding domain-containing protein [Spirochaetota bacterium]
MKGVIVNCLKELVITKFGEDKWREAMEKSGLDPNMAFTSLGDVEDGAVMTVIQNVCKVLNITLEQAADAFGDYWVNEFAPKMYPRHFENIKSSKEFLMKMDKVHEMTTANMANAHPPRFNYKEKDEKTLIMTYNSKRGLMPIFLGLIKGVGKHYKENLKITALNDKDVEIKFP